MEDSTEDLKLIYLTEVTELKIYSTNNFIIMFLYGMLL